VCVLVEIKNRTTTTLTAKHQPSLLLADFVQIQCYLHMYIDIRLCHLVQLLWTQRVVDLSVTEIERDDAFWCNMILPSVWRMARLVHTFMSKNIKAKFDFINSSSKQKCKVIAAQLGCIPKIVSTKKIKSFDVILQT